MLKKQNLTEFYSQFAATVEVFNIMHESNNELEKAIIGNSQLQQNIAVVNPILDASQRYILSHVHDSQLHQIAEHLCECMHSFKFKKSSSVPRNTKLIGEHATTTDYELLAKINLYNHTINCAVCAIEASKNQPQKIRDIVIVIALLHDFGKSPKILRLFNNINADHEKISARFAENVLNDFNVSDELNQVIFSTLFDYHTSDKDKEKTIYAPIVIQADIASRILEKKFLNQKSRK